ncbi:DUF418 domain-containing protein [Corynebacterium kutscheri]|uniref:DUF418 domain-containing protein n=1 Tax=Corynebacterium kutscheri TaxID=35755 RepID=UPI0037C0FA06
MTSRSPAVATTQRLIVPDFMRGFALLGIAIANITTAWVFVDSSALGTRTMYGLISAEHTLLDQITMVVTGMFAHVRGLPMFATLFGYGLAFLVNSAEQKSWPINKARRVLWRRYVTLAIFGSIHAVFIFFGDIIFLYSLLALLLICLINFSEKILLWIAGVCFTLGALIAIGSAALESKFSLGSSAALVNLETYGEQLVFGLGMVLANTFLFIIIGSSIIPCVIIGYVAGRRRMLSNVDQYRKPLTIAAVITLCVCIGIGIPFGLSVAGIVGNPSLWVGINTGLGIASGPGFIALVALLFDARPALQSTLFVRMCAALGKRSMTGYIAQSLLMIVLVVNYGPLALGTNQGVSVLVGLAIVVWVITLVGAWILELKNIAGPIETLHRRIAYSKPTPSNMVTQVTN